MKVVIFTADSNGGYPVPAVRGGAVSILIEHLISENQMKKQIKLKIVSLYDERAKAIALERYSNIDFEWVCPPKFVKLVDKAIYCLFKTVFRKKKAVSFLSLASLVYYICVSARLLRKDRYDKVVLENNILMAWIIKLSKYKGNYYYHLHNIPRVNAGCKSVFSNATGILCVSKFVSDAIQTDKNAIGPISPKKTKILYNCIDTNLFRVIDDKRLLIKTREKYGVNENDNVIIFVGRLSKEKGIDKLLEAIQNINVPNVRVLIVGSLIHNTEEMDDYQVKLHELASSLSDKVIFTGYVNQDELPLLYNISDVAALPSMWDEPAGLTMIEALACGVPVVTTASGGIPEYVSDCAIVFQRDEKVVENLSKSITILLKKTIDKDERQRKGIARIKDNFDKEMYLDRFISNIK